MSSADHGLTPAEQHLGDRLAALVDGELGHDARERVLSHLATCWSCKAEADAQRQLKNVFADTAPPPPSEGLLARLQGLPAGGDTDAESGPGAGPGGADDPGGAGHSRVFGGRPGRSPLHFDYLPAGRGASALTPERGFRIHRVPDVERSPSRGRRFAFVAAGAFSLAALALGGALNSSAAGGAPLAGGERGGASAVPARTAAPAPTPSPGATERDARRRAATDQSGRRTGTPAAPAPATTSAPRTQLLASMPVPTRVHPLLSGSSAFAPSLIRPPSALSRSFSSEQRTPLGALPGRHPAAVAPTPTPSASAATPGS